MIRMFRESLTVETAGNASLIPITGQLDTLIQRSDIRNGLCNLLLLHTSASLLVQEKDAVPDIECFFTDLVPEGDHYLLAGEGPDDMPSHIRSALTSSVLTLPIEDGSLALAHLQDVFLWEQRRQEKTRKLLITLMGE